MFSELPPPVPTGLLGNALCLKCGVEKISNSVLQNLTVTFTVAQKQRNTPRRGKTVKDRRALGCSPLLVRCWCCLDSAFSYYLTSVAGACSLCLSHHETSFYSNVREVVSLEMWEACVLVWSWSLGLKKNNKKTKEHVMKELKLPRSLNQMSTSLRYTVHCQQKKSSNMH